MHWFAGTSGYSYKEWKGVFYPETITPADMLAYYGRQLPAVEINNTFYRMPRTHVLESWRDAVPEDFRFVIKASRRSRTRPGSTTTARFLPNASRSSKTGWAACCSSCLPTCART